MLSLAAALVAGALAAADPRITEVNPLTDSVVITNLGDAPIDLSSHRMCAGFSYGDVSAQTVVAGSTTLGPGGILVLDLSISLADAGSDVGLYLPSGSFGSAAAMVDFVQYGSSGNGRESVAVTKGIWSAGDFVAIGLSPFAFTGTPGQYGVSFWAQAAPVPRFVSVDPTTDVVSIRNFGNAVVDISTYRFCALFSYGAVSGETINSGSLLLGPGNEVEVAMGSGVALADAGSDLGLYLPTGSFSSAAAMVDFFQYGTSGNGRESVAVAKGIWSAGATVMGDAPYTFTGAAAAFGPTFWTSDPGAVGDPILIDLFGHRFAAGAQPNSELLLYASPDSSERIVLKTSSLFGVEGGYFVNQVRFERAGCGSLLVTAHEAKHLSIVDADSCMEQYLARGDDGLVIYSIGSTGTLAFVVPHHSTTVSFLNVKFMSVTEAFKTGCHGMLCDEGHHDVFA